MRTAILLALLAVGVFCGMLPKGAIYLGNGRYSYSAQPRTSPIRKSINYRSPFGEASDRLEKVLSDTPKCSGSSYFCGTSSRSMSDKKLIHYIAHIIRMNPKDVEQKEVELAAKLNKDLLKKLSHALKPTVYRPFVAARERDDAEDLSDRNGPVGQKNSNKDKSMADIYKTPVIRERRTGKEESLSELSRTIQQKRFREELSDHKSQKKPQPPKSLPIETLKPTRRPVTLEPQKAMFRMSDPFKWKKHMKENFRGPIAFAKNRRDPWGDVGDDDEMGDKLQAKYGNMNTKNNKNPFEPESEQVTYGKKGGPATKVPEVESDAEKSKNGVWVPSKRDLEKIKKIQQFK